MGYPWEAQKGRTAGANGLAAVTVDKFIGSMKGADGFYDYSKPHPRAGELRYRLDYLVKTLDGSTRGGSNTIAVCKISAPTLAKLCEKFYADFEKRWEPEYLTQALRDDVETLTEHRAEYQEAAAPAAHKESAPRAPQQMDLGM